MRSCTVNSTVIITAIVIRRDLQVSGIQDAAKRVWEKMGTVKEKKAKLKYQCECNGARCFGSV
jgi:hypothetical protein